MDCKLKNIQDDCYDAHHNQVDCSLMAYNDDGICIGYIDYSLFEKKTYVNIIEVHKECRRRGIASQLLDKINKKHDNIKYGLATKDGWELLQKWKKK